MKPDEKAQLQVLGIDRQDGLTMRIKKTEPSSEDFKKSAKNRGEAIQNDGKLLGEIQLNQSRNRGAFKDENVPSLAVQ
jgi:hypothetical protein